MEDNSTPTNYQSSRCVHQIIDRILNAAFMIIQSRRISHIMDRQMPQNYLNYIGDVSQLIYTHKVPAEPRQFAKIITEPTQSDSRQLHHPNPLRKVHKTYQIEEEEESLIKKQSRKQSICLSHRSRMSASRIPTRKYMSRRKIIENNKLIPLNRVSESRDQEPEGDRIAHLRKRKIKLQEAMKAFKDQDRPDKFFQSKKTKENHLNFTTDFKGKILAFNPKAIKVRKQQTNQLVIKFETLVQSSRSWANTNLGKVSSSTRRNLFGREGTNMSQQQMNDR